MPTRCSGKCPKETTLRTFFRISNFSPLLKNNTRVLFILFVKFRVGSGSGHGRSTVAPEDRSTVGLGVAGQLGSKDDPR